MSGPSAPHPVLFLALDAATSAVLLLHHFGIASTSAHQRGGPHFAALCMDRVDEDTPPQVVHASAADLCRHVTFSKPRIALKDVDNMAKGETLFSTSRTKKSTVTSVVLLPIPLQWAPLFLTEEEPINAKDTFVALSKLASSIHRHTTAYATVMTFAWGLITRRTPKAPKPVVAVALTTPRLDRALTTWRKERLQGVFKSPPSSTAFVDLTSVAADDADAPPSSTRGVDLFQEGSGSAAFMPHPPGTSPVGRDRAGHVDKDSPAITCASKLVGRDRSASPVGRDRAGHVDKDSTAIPGTSTPVGRDRSARPVAKDRAALVRKPTPSSHLSAPQPDPTTAALLASNNTVLRALTALLEGKSNPRARMTPHDDDPTISKVPPCKFMARRAAPFQSWAGVPPGHLCKKLPPLFGEIIEASSNERHHLVTGFFCQLERLNSRMFAGFQPTDDLVDDISKLKLASPQGSKWHRGIGPMAFANRSLKDIDKQTENRDLWNAYGDHLTLAMADAKKLESATPLAPADFEAFLLPLHRHDDFHLATLGPPCNIYIKTSRVVTNLTALQHRIARSPEFMPMRAPSIIWMLTVATQEFYAEAATATQFATADAQGDAPPRTSFNLDVYDIFQQALRHRGVRSPHVPPKCTGPPAPTRGEPIPT
jgi:hypothetical protein